MKLVLLLLLIASLSVAINMNLVHDDYHHWHEEDHFVPAKTIDKLTNQVPLVSHQHDVVKAQTIQVPKPPVQPCTPKACLLNQVPHGECPCIRGYKYNMNHFEPQYKPHQETCEELTGLLDCKKHKYLMNHFEPQYKEQKIICIDPHGCPPPPEHIVAELKPKLDHIVPQLKPEHPIYHDDHYHDDHYHDDHLEEDAKHEVHEEEEDKEEPMDVAKENESPEDESQELGGGVVIPGKKKIKNIDTAENDDEDDEDEGDDDDDDEDSKKGGTPPTKKNDEDQAPNNDEDTASNSGSESEESSSSVDIDDELNEDK